MTEQDICWLWAWLTALPCEAVALGLGWETGGAVCIP